jgi:hypothetical protein
MRRNDGRKKKREKRNFGGERGYFIKKEKAKKWGGKED